MGTNFYWLGEPEPPQLPESVVVTLPNGHVEEISAEWNIYDMDPTWHIGKRSAAGPWCWKCDRTLCRQGTHAVHGGDTTWHDTCPGCGAPNLGYQERQALCDAGTSPDVRGCCSFSWAQARDPVIHACEASPNQNLVRDEYGKRYTGLAFLEMIDSIRIHQYGSIGQMFS